MMYQMYGTSSAKANDLRAAGLNAMLGDVSASGNVGSGASATAAESAQMMPSDFSFVGNAASSGLAGYNSTRSVDASVSLQKSQENVNKSIEGVNIAHKGLMESQTDMQKMTYIVTLCMMPVLRLVVFIMLCHKKLKRMLLKLCLFMLLHFVILLQENIPLSKPKITASGYLFSRR